MYNLSYFKENEAAIILDFIKQHSFAMIIGVDDEQRPVATQVPVLIKERNKDLFLQAHIMRNTDHHKAFENNSNVLVVFTGPHCYVSASWYENKLQASTWNYQTVHMKGTLSFLDDSTLLKILDELTSKYENNPASPSLYSNLSDDYINRLSKAIQAFEINVTGIENVFKLSQNKDKKSYENIIEQLSIGNSDEQYIAREMEKRKSKIFS